MSLFDHYVNALSMELGITLEPEFSCLDFEVDDLTVRLRYDESSDTVTCTAVVHDLGEQPSPEHQADLAIRCLEGQYCFAQTAGFSLGLSPDDRHLLLQGRWILAGLSARQFIDSLESFVKTGRLATIFLDEAGKKSPAAAPEVSGNAAGDMLRV